MAKQLNGMRIRATIGGITYYVVGDQGYARKKSSLTAQRVKKDKKFEKTRQYAKDLGLASKIASPIYQALPLDVKGRWLFRAIAGEAASLLYEGKTEEEVSGFLRNKYIHAPQGLTDEQVTQSEGKNLSMSSKKIRYELWKIFRDRWDAQDKPVYIFKRIWERRGVFRNENIPKTLGIVNVV
jgi:hypothetical protein